MKKLFLALTMLVTFLISSVAMAAGMAKLNDGAGLLKANEKQAVLQTMQNVADKHNICILAYTTKSLQKGLTARSVARSMVDVTYKNEPAVVFYIDMGTRNWYLAANSHLNKPAITQDYGVDYINKDMSSLLKKGQYAAALTNYATRVDELMTFAKKNGHAHTADDDFNLYAMVAAVVLAGLAAYGVRSSLVASMTNVHPAVEAKEYLIQDSFDVSESSDTYLYTHTTVVPRAKSGGGGGSDGSSGCSGGGGSF